MIIGQAGNAPLKFAQKTITFDGNSGTGAVGSVPIFTITGQVEVALIVPICTTTLTGASATLALGVTGNTTGFIGATTATGITTSARIWMSTSPTANLLAVPSALKDVVIESNIIGTVATAAVSGGAIQFNVYYLQLSPGSGLS